MLATYSHQNNLTLRSPYCGRREIWGTPVIQTAGYSTALFVTHDFTPNQQKRGRTYNLYEISPSFFTTCLSFVLCRHNLRVLLQKIQRASVISILIGKVTNTLIFHTRLSFFYPLTPLRFAESMKSINSTFSNHTLTPLPDKVHCRSSCVLAEEVRCKDNGDRRKTSKKDLSNTIALKLT